VIVRTEAYAPGRVELLGNHTDYNGGIVLGAAIDRGLTVTGRCREDELIRISSARMGSMQIRRAELCPQTEHPWANYVLGVVSELDSLGLPIPNFSVRVNGDLPAECGLASSAALEVATALFLLKLSRAELPQLQIAKLCQRVEHQFVGVQSGLLDQVCSIFGREEHAVFFDAGNEEVRTIPFPRGFALNQVATGNSPAGSIISGAKKRSWPLTPLASRLCEMRLAPPSKNPICPLYCCVAPPTSLAKTSGSGERLTFSPPLTVSLLARL
jgi:galactokinase